MNELTVSRPLPSRVCWDNLEVFARQQIQTFLQGLLEEEVTELLGRTRSQRREREETQPGTRETAYRNGHGKPRRLTTPCGTIEVRRPRVRGLTERFESRILPLF